MTAYSHAHTCLSVDSILSSFSGKEETGDEEEADNGNVALWTINTCSQPVCSGCLLMSFVIKN